MKVLSLFDGLSCGRLALEKVGIKVDRYFASEIEKSAIKITQSNYPDTIQVGDVTKVRFKDGVLYTENGDFEVGKIDLLIGGSPCFVGGTKVITSTGYKNIEDIQVGDMVLTHKNQYRKVVETGGSFKETITIKAQGIRETTTTKNHPYYVRTMGRFWDNPNRTYVRTFSEPAWKEAGELTKNDFVGLPIIKTEKNPLNLTSEECWILGRYVADGHYRKSKRKERIDSYQYQLILSVGSHKISGIEENVKENHYSLFPHTKSVHRCVFSSMHLVNMVEKLGFGNKAGVKRIPQEILNLPLDLLKRFLDGYMAGDGSFSEGKYRANSVSDELIMGLNLAIAKVYRVNSGFVFTKRPKTKVIEGRTVNQMDTYTVEFRKEEKKQTHAVVIDDIIWLPVRSVTETGFHQTVFNIEVEEDNSYTANNAIVHNCQGFSYAGKQLNFQDPRSKLFFEYTRILEELKAGNPQVLFLLENTNMKPMFQDVITRYLGVEPVAINSSMLLPQNRLRLYWSNIDITPPTEFTTLKLRDILDAEPDKASFLSDKGKAYMEREKAGKPRWKSYPNPLDGLAGCLTANMVKGVPYGVIMELGRFLTPEECEKLQGVPIGFTKVASFTQRRKALGNGWTVDVIAQCIFKNIKINSSSLSAAV